VLQDFYCQEFSRRIGRRLRPLFAILLALGTIGCPTICSADDEALEQFKAVYLFNFAKLTVWPATAPAYVLTMCFIGAPGVRDLIERDVSGKLIGARHVEVRSLGPSERADDCSIVYIDPNIVGASSLAATAPAYALTVSDARDFAQRGGMIELYFQDNRLRFIINLDNARLAGLKMSSSLLALASKVEQLGSP
jgi:YfiR/HmsC-like